MLFDSWCFIVSKYLFRVKKNFRGKPVQSHKTAKFPGSVTSRMRYRGHMAIRSTKPDKPEKEKREKVSIYLPPDLAQELRMEAVRQRRRLSVVAEQFVREGIAASAKVRAGK